MEFDKRSKGKKVHNHFVPKFYLDRWSNDDNELLYFDLSEENYILKKPKNTYKVTELYMTGDFQNLEYSDRLEISIDNKVENPMAQVIADILRTGSIRREHFDTINRYVFLQNYRTPHFMIKLTSITESIVKNEFDNIQKYIDHYQPLTSEGKKQLIDDPKEGFPRAIEPLKAGITNNNELELEYLVGKSQFLSVLERIVNGEFSDFYLNFALIKSHVNIKLPTSDNPIINLKEGQLIDEIGQDNLEVLFPISPDYVLYATRGKVLNPIIGNTQLTLSESLKLRDLIILNARDSFISTEKYEQIIINRARKSERNRKTDYSGLIKGYKHKEIDYALETMQNKKGLIL